MSENMSWAQVGLYLSHTGIGKNERNKSTSRIAGFGCCRPRSLSDRYLVASAERVDARLTEGVFESPALRLGGVQEQAETE